MNRMNLAAESVGVLVIEWGGKFPRFGEVGGSARMDLLAVCSAAAFTSGDTGENTKSREVVDRWAKEPFVFSCRWLFKECRPKQTPS